MNVPKHIAMIMDGNGRWAKQRNLPRLMGHRSGVENVYTVTEECARMGVRVLTLYAFSTENWKRSSEEVSGLMSLLEQSLKKYIGKLKNNGIRLNVIGRLEQLPERLRGGISNALETTASNDRMVLNIALNYGGRQEILDAARSIVRAVKDENIDVTSLTVDDFSRYLYTRDLPDPELIIRTSGEQRISNFLLWQCAYSEFYFTDTFWPDFGKEELKKAIEEYSRRERRFGE